MSFFDLRKAADGNLHSSLANRFRGQRFILFASLIERLPKPVKVIDIGGTLSYWQQRGWVGKEGVQITIINLNVVNEVCKNVIVKNGNAIDLSEYPDASFDVAYSNSVIEHLFTLDSQKKMAVEVRRISKAFWVQTPNYWFPIEPHFHVPGWQWLPRQIRVALLMRFRCGWNGPISDRKEAERVVDEVRLLTEKEFLHLFPGARLWREKFVGLTKSLVIYDGFDFKKI